MPEPSSENRQAVARIPRGARQRRSCRVADTRRRWWRTEMRLTWVSGLVASIRWAVLTPIEVVESADLPVDVCMTDPAKSRGSRA